MKANSTIPANIDEYISDFNEDVQQLLQKLRQTIRKAAPDAEEIISYAMPTFYLKGNLVHFAAYQKHIGFYPAASGVEAFKQALAAYKTSKGAIQFPIDQPLPLTLVTKIVKYRVQQNLERADLKVRIKELKTK